jgi:N-acetylneuraminic acid mutarotase
MMASNSWSLKQSLSPWRQSMAAGTINGTIYVVGGWRRDQTALARVDAYNVASNTWSQVASLPQARVDPHGATVINGKLYVVGGRNNENALTKTLFVYTPGTNTWARRADAPVAGCGGAQGMIGGQLYVYTARAACLQATGQTGTSTMGEFFRYNPVTNMWTRRATPPHDHWGGVAGVINGKLYVAAGLSTATLDVYDPATNMWATKAPLAHPRTQAVGTMLNGKLVVAGGSQEFELATVEVYDPMSNMWTMKAPLPNAFADGAAAAAGGKLFAIEGVTVTREPGPSRVYAYSP